MIFIFLALTEEEKTFIEKIYREQKYKYLNISKKICASTEDAEDAVSEAFEKIMKKAEIILQLERHIIEPYCVVIVKHESYNILRKKNRKINIEETSIHKIQEPQNIEADLLEQEAYEELFRNLRRLQAKDRELVRLRFFENMSYKEIGQRMGISADAARKRHERILDRLRKLYEGGSKDEGAF